MIFLAINEDQVAPGVGAFFVVAALGVTLFLLIRSMNKQIGRIEAPSEEDLRQEDWERRQEEKGEKESTPRGADRPDADQGDE